MARDAGARPRAGGHGVSGDASTRSGDGVMRPHRAGSWKAAERAEGGGARPAIPHAASAAAARDVVGCALVSRSAQDRGYRGRLARTRGGKVWRSEAGGSQASE